MKILYAGDSPEGGPANYMLAVLKHLKARFVHVPPAKKLTPNLFHQHFDAIILSDFPKSKAPSDSEKKIAQQVEGGTGLMMVGGWNSFASGGWQNSTVAKILPVDCAEHDDRMNLPSGAVISFKKSHPVFKSIHFKNPPVICGLNRIKPKRGSSVLLSAKKIVTHSNSRPALDLKEFPLLAVDSNRGKCIAAFAADIAPHWCGGLLDWGKSRRKLQVSPTISIEVGEFYLGFLSNLVLWLCGKIWDGH